MRIAIVGQQDFGKAVLEAFLARGDQVAGVFCAPEKPGAKPDVLKTAAQEKGVQVFQFLIGGTSLLIVVSVVLETMRQINAQLQMHEYEKF